eukprot:CAMPEP_0203804544 /NCGR_PEP_ID=MMETSP0100_2-20121128/13644_1 /ASSEMBLY_ACC=CAM_ASM_000210 /TAXON_ID=96639 /ORGANISM=" , Strain NY0313808BC1" /LENGTH=143 /DNA_ID=CAMNT_0050712775 /DNA_START=19 /DNA_END=448 /DNA_ORIENTATION=+
MSEAIPRHLTLHSCIVIDTDKAQTISGLPVNGYFCPLGKVPAPTAGYSDSKELVEGFITENVPIPEFVQDGELRDDVRFFTVPAEILDDDDRRLEMSSLRKSPVPSSGGCILGHCKVCCKLSSTTAATTTTFDDCLSQSAKYP